MNIVNIMNFVRGCEPREPELDLLLPIKEELELCKKYAYKSSCLLQYDAMLREDIMEVVTSYQENTEYGVWIELCRQLCEAVSLEWKGRLGWDWDWHVNTGFLQGYSQNERKKIIDEVMRLFKEKFGYYPKSVGSWILDAFSIEYMQKKYNIKAFGICREQFGIDAYTLVGGYYNQAYYPSKYNCICPATSEENKIAAPVFRLLGPDPIYNYGADSFYESASGMPRTIEPAWEFAQNEKTIRWFYDSYFNRESKSFSYIQLGQENSFGWDLIGKGLPLQFEILKEYIDNGKCTLMTMGETGEWFIKNYKDTPMNAIGAKRLYENEIDESQWLCTKYYRVNFVSEKEKFYIRDIYKFDEKYVESCYNEPCTEWNITYENLPVMDGYRWAIEETSRAGIFFDGKYKSMSIRKDNDNFVIDVEFEDRTAEIIMTEEKIIIHNSDKIRFIKNDSEDVIFNAERIDYNHNNTKYSVPITGVCNSDGVIAPTNNKIVFDLSK